MSRILHIDGFNYFYQQFNVNAAANENGEPIGGFVGMINQIQKLVYKFKPAKVVLHLDGPQAGLRRHSIMPGYKGKHPPKKRLAKVGDGTAFQTNNEEFQLLSAFNFVRQLPITTLLIPFYEADDVISHLVRANPQHEHIICSSDKDYLQLVSENVSVWSWGKKTLFSPQNTIETYSVMPENFVYFRSIVGDASDKLSGVPGIGDKTVLKLIPQLGTQQFLDFEEFWNHVKDLKQESIIETKTKNNLVKLQANEQQVRLMYKLMNLRDNSLKAKAIEQLQQQLEEQTVPHLSKMSLHLYCVKNQLESHIRHYDKWIRPFVFLKKSISLST